MSGSVFYGTTYSGGSAGIYGTVFSLNLAPVLTVQLTTTNTVAISWPSPSTDFVLQENTNGIATANWSNVTATIQDNGTTKTFVVNPPTGNGFYRLFHP